MTSKTLIDTPYGKKTPDLLCAAMDALESPLYRAAPDLLAALELALSHIGWCWDVIEQNTNLTRGGSAIVHDQIRDAIAKATGEQPASTCQHCGRTLDSDQPFCTSDDCPNSNGGEEF